MPLVVVSRHLAYACRVPRALFDTLASHGGRMGKNMRDSQRACIDELWERCETRSRFPPARLLLTCADQCTEPYIRSG